MHFLTIGAVAVVVAASACNAQAVSDATTDGSIDASDASDGSTEIATESGTDAQLPPQDVGYQPVSPWPKFRGNARQDALGLVHATTTGGAMWSFPTGNGVFSSPVVGADGTVYVGSADQNFYAINPDGTMRWMFPTGEIIDSAALLDDRGTVYFGSGDGHEYALNAQTGAMLWAFAADPPSTNSAYINWFEGNVALGPEGNLYVPNDNFFVYALNRTDGTILWRYRMPDQTWSLPAVDSASGNIFIGNNNLLSLLGANTFAFTSGGQLRWRHATNGSVAASPLLTPDGIVVVGGFDGYARAYEANLGMPLWTFAARDHIYSSPARLPNGTVIQPSADASIYGLDPHAGRLLWQFDTLEPIRSSPAVDADGNIYVGGGDGRLYVLNPSGTLRWSLALSTAERHNLNASPALGNTAVYIAGEDGMVYSVPYEYCLRPQAQNDPNCTTTGGQNLPTDTAHLYFTTQLGAPLLTPPTTIDANEILAFTLLVRAGDATQLALIDSTTLQVTSTPPAQLTVEVSGDRKFVTVVPQTELTGDATGHVQIAITGQYLESPMRSGLALTGGTVAGPINDTFSFALSPNGPSALPLPVPANTQALAGVWQLYRLAAPLPTILPSYNQIGFDSLYYLLGLVEGTGAQAVGWIAGATLAPDGSTVIDPTTRAMFPVAVTYDNGRITFQNDDSLQLEVMNLTLPFQSFRLTAALDATGQTLATPRLNVTSVCGDIPTYGTFLEQLGFCNPDTDVLNVFGAALLAPYNGGTQSPPTGVGMVAFSASTTGVTATLTASTLVATAHAYAVLLVDASSGQPVSLDYGPSGVVTPAADGTVASVSVPFGTHTVPPAVRVYLMVDTYPAASGMLMLP